MFPEASRQLAFNFPAHQQMSGDEAVVVRDDLTKNDVMLLHQKRLSSYLSMLLQETIEVAFTDNRTTMISFSKKTGIMRLRLHKMFQVADETVLKALSVFIRRIPSEAASKKIDDFIKANNGQIRKRTHARRAKVIPQGTHFHLDEVLERVSNRFFAGEISSVHIGWGQFRGRRRRRGRIKSRALATYCFEDTTIRVNPILDSPRVPMYIIDWVVYHELLHHILPVERAGSQRRYHTTKFRMLERAYPQYEDARAWEKQNLDWLLK